MILLLLTASRVEAQALSSKKTVNVLSWWGYFNNPRLVMATENQCNVHLSVDQYYSNAEFRRRYQANKAMYDVIVFSNTNYLIMHDSIPVIATSPLHLHAKSYHPVIKQHYQAMNYPNNIAYFAHSLTGFLYNPRFMSIDDKDSLSDLFVKAKKHHVVILDDATEMNQLFKLEFHASSKIGGDYLKGLNLVNGYNKQSDVYIGNGIRNMYDSDNLAFAISWSGESLKRINTSKEHYLFYIHPKLSYMSTDLIAQVAKNSRAECVSNYLSGQYALSLMQDNNYYFSPYASISTVTDEYFRQLYKRFLYLLPLVAWIDPVSEHGNDQINQSWDAIKLKLDKKSYHYE